MKKRFNPLIAGSLAGLAVFAFTTKPAAAQTQTFETTGEAAQTVRFVARHSLGPVDGTLHPVVGELTFDPAAPTEGLTARFTADVASFDTDLGLRDKDMKENYLETDTYPTAAFSLDDARPTILPDTKGETLHLAITGTMTLHGVTKQHPVEATLTPTDGGYRVRASFPLLLSDYNIRQPKRFFFTVDDQIQVEVHLTLVKKP